MLLNVTFDTLTVTHSVLPKHQGHMTHALHLSHGARHAEHVAERQEGKVDTWIFPYMIQSVHYYTDRWTRVDGGEEQASHHNQG